MEGLLCDLHMDKWVLVHMKARYWNFRSPPLTSDCGNADKRTYRLLDTGLIGIELLRIDNPANLSSLEETNRFPSSQIRTIVAILIC